MLASLPLYLQRNHHYNDSRAGNDGRVHGNLGAEMGDSGSKEGLHRRPGSCRTRQRNPEGCSMASQDVRLLKTHHTKGMKRDLGVNPGGDASKER